MIATLVIFLVCFSFVSASNKKRKDAKDECTEILVYFSEFETEHRYALKNGFYGGTTDVRADLVCAPANQIVVCVLDRFNATRHEGARIDTDRATLGDALDVGIDSIKLFDKRSSTTWLKIYVLDDEKPRIGHLENDLVDCAHKAQRLGETKVNSGDKLEQASLILIVVCWAIFAFVLVVF